MGCEVGGKSTECRRRERTEERMETCSEWKEPEWSGPLCEISEWMRSSSSCLGRDGVSVSRMRWSSSSDGVVVVMMEVVHSIQAPMPHIFFLKVCDGFL